jgi:peroxiredoxin Q/BCP
MAGSSCSPRRSSSGRNRARGGANVKVLSGGARRSARYRLLPEPAGANRWQMMKTRAARLLSASALVLSGASLGCDGAASTPAPTSSSAAPSASAMAAPVVAPLKEGEMAPDVDLTLQNGKSVKLSSFRGKVVAIYFYPKDETQGCTVEAQGIRDLWQALSAAEIMVIGVSMQDAESHQRFIDKEKLPFDLAVDTSGELARAFHVPTKGEYAARQTFLIGADGRIKKIWEKVTPAGHAQEILAAVKGG